MQGGLSFLLITICALYLPPNQLGIIGLTEAAGIVVAHISLMALPGGLRRLYFSSESDEQRNLLISSILRGGITIAILSTIISMLLGPLILRITSNSLPDFFPYFAVAISCQIWYQFFEYRLTLFQVYERPVSYALLQILIGVSIFSSVIYFVVIRDGCAEDYLFGRLVAVLIINLFVIYTMKKFFFYGWSREKFNLALHYSIPLIPHVLAMTILNFADRYLLEAYSTTDDVGVYTLAYTLGLAMYLVTVAFSMAWAPYFFRAVNKGKSQYQEIHDNAGKAVSISTAIALFGIMISGDFVTFVFSEKYQSAASIVPLIIAGYLLFFLCTLFSYSILHEKKTHLMAPITIVSAIVNIVLNIWLIPDYRMAGAAWATIISFGLQTLAVYLIAVRLLPVPYPIEKIIFVLGLFLVILTMTQYDEVDHVIVYICATASILVVLKMSFILPSSIFRNS